MVGTDDRIDGVTAAYAAAVLGKDLERLATLYAPDARIFDAWDVWSYEGREAWRHNLEAWLGSLGDEAVQAGFEDVQVVEMGEAAALSATVTYAALDAEGAVLRSMQNRLSWVLRRTEGRWLIVHEHTSAPIAFEGQRPILQRG